MSDCGCPGAPTAFHLLAPATPSALEEQGAGQVEDPWIQGGNSQLQLEGKPHFMSPRYLLSLGPE